MPPRAAKLNIRNLTLGTRVMILPAYSHYHGMIGVVVGPDKFSGNYRVEFSHAQLSKHKDHSLAQKPITFWPHELEAL